MSRFAGTVGYTVQEETTPGVWTTVEKTRKMKGDIMKQVASHQSSEYLHDDVVLSHRVSLIGDAYAFDNYFNISWVKMDTQKWKVASIEVDRPRIIVTLGGVWNESKVRTT